MKRRELLKLLRTNGWRLLRNGSSHDVYTDGKHLEVIPRHADINENLARGIIRKWGLK